MTLPPSVAVAPVTDTSRAPTLPNVTRLFAVNPPKPVALPIVLVPDPFKLRALFAPTIFPRTVVAADPLFSTTSEVPRFVVLAFITIAPLVVEIEAFRLTVGTLPVPEADAPLAPAKVSPTPAPVMATSLSTVMAFEAASTTLAPAALRVPVERVTVLATSVPACACPRLPAPAAAITIFRGSSSHVPARPPGAVASTRAVSATTRFCRPDVSTNPPLPVSEPPRAKIRPANPVLPSAQTMTFPPSPEAVASAMISTPCPTTARLAFWSAGLPPR